MTKCPVTSSLQSGFTLIELMVVFSLIVILSSVGIASFVEYNHTEQVNVAASDFRSMLYTARSRAFSQLRDSSCYSGTFTGSGYVLKGYQVVACCSFPLCSSAACNTTGNDYELQAVYAYPDGSGATAQTCVAKKFSDPHVTISSDTNNTTATYFFFASITGAVTTNTSTPQAKIGITGYGTTKIAQVSAVGIIQ